ncbi:MAG: hypothetical protein ABI183_06210, partial [Polyangiaceae bacterium]
PGSVADDDIDLPPLDGGSEDESVDESDSEDLDPVPADAGNDAFDDATGTDDPVDPDEIDDLDDEDGSALENHELANDLDDQADFLEDRASELASGLASGLLEESVLGDDEGQGVGDEDFGIGDDEATAAMDAGEEGPQDADEELREEDLPALDADELGEGDERDFFELESSAAPPFAWAEPRWESRAVALVGPTIALVVNRSNAIAIGVDPPQMWRIEADHAEPLLAEGAPREGWRALRSNRKTGEISLETDTGAFFSQDGGRHFTHRIEAVAPSSPPAHRLLEMEQELRARTVDLRGRKLVGAAILDEAGTIVGALQAVADSAAATWVVRISSAGLVETIGVVRGVVWDLTWDEPTARIWIASDDGVTIFASSASLTTS